MFRVIGEWDEGVDGEPRFAAVLDKLVVGQDEVRRVEGGPGIVGQEVVAESETAKETGLCHVWHGVEQDGVGEEGFGLLLD